MSTIVPRNVRIKKKFFDLENVLIVQEIICEVVQQLVLDAACLSSDLTMFLSSDGLWNCRVCVFVFANLTTATNSRRTESKSKSESTEGEARQTNWGAGKRKYPRYR